MEEVGKKSFSVENWPYPRNGERQG